MTVTHLLPDGIDGNEFEKQCSSLKHEDVDLLFPVKIISHSSNAEGMHNDSTLTLKSEMKGPSKQFSFN